VPLFFALDVDFLHRLPHATCMYIRKTKTKTLDDGEAYYTYRLVESVREGQQVKQRTLLNLGKDFAIEPQHWSQLTARIEQLLQDAQAQQVEVFTLADEIGVLLETAAQRYSRLIVHKLAQPVEPLAADYQRVDINRVDAVESRSIGAETLALHAVDQLQLAQKLTALGLNGVDRAAALGSIIGRMVSPGSELHTHQWLQSCTALGELLDHDFGSTSLTRLYKVSDPLLKHQAALEGFLADQEQTLFDLNRCIVMYDLTNTYFEGQCAGNPKAQFGRSKEKRSDCPLVTLGLVLDGDGFPLGSQVFPGNASEPATLKTLLEGLQGKNPLATPKPVIILDAGIASADNIAWLVKHAYRYIVVSRERQVKDPREQDSAPLIRDTGRSQVRVYRDLDADSGETRLYCYSEQKAKKEYAIRNRFHERLEAALTQLQAGLSQKGTVKNYVKILERIGRLREKNSRVAQGYQIDVTPDAAHKNAVAIAWQRQAPSAEKDRQCGVYCLRSNMPDWSEEQLWTTYVMLTEIEATFRSLKTELGLRPVYHQKEDRVTGHLFITLLAYHLGHTLRHQLKLKGIHLSWDSIRTLMATQQRVTLILPTDEQTLIYLRTTTRAEVQQQEIYAALGIKADPLGKRKTSVSCKKSVVPTDSG
jgi:transposase